MVLAIVIVVPFDFDIMPVFSDYSIYTILNLARWDIHIAPQGPVHIDEGSVVVVVLVVDSYIQIRVLRRNIVQFEVVLSPCVDPTIVPNIIGPVILTVIVVMPFDPDLVPSLRDFLVDSISDSTGRNVHIAPIPVVYVDVHTMIVVVLVVDSHIEVRRKYPTQ
jgi:hypothetical protein